MRKIVNGVRDNAAIILLSAAALLVFLALLAAATRGEFYLVVFLLGMALTFLGLATIDRRTLNINHRALNVHNRASNIEHSLRHPQSGRTIGDEELTGLSGLRDILVAAEERRRLDDAAREQRVLKLMGRLDARLKVIEGKDDVSELTALLNLFQVLAPTGVLTPPTSFSASPRTVSALVAEVLSTDKALWIVECGSGSSTVWLAAACRHLSRGSVLALEHDERYALETRQALERCDLLGYAEVRHAPLQHLSLDDRSFRWYAPSAYADIERIDVLFVDGPPASTGPLARYPAFPLLAPLLSDGALVVMDDAERSDESDTVEQWLAARDLGGVLTTTSRAGRAMQMRWSRSQ